MEKRDTQNNTKSGKRDSNPRPSVWETDALPLSYSRNATKLIKLYCSDTTPSAPASCILVGGV